MAKKDLVPWNCPVCGKRYGVPRDKLPPEKCVNCRKAEASFFARADELGPASDPEGYVMRETAAEAEPPGKTFSQRFTEWRWYMRGVIDHEWARIDRATLRIADSSGPPIRKLLEILSTPVRETKAWKLFWMIVPYVAVMWGVYWFGTNLGEPKKPIAPYSMWGLVAVFSGSSLILGRKYHPRRRLIVPAILMAGLAATWAFCRYDVYEIYWISEPKGEMKIEFTDRFRRDGSIIYRRALFYDGGDIHGEGPMAGDHKIHGEWTFLERPNYKRRKEWYWYGDKITEGEWHLRNK